MSFIKVSSIVFGVLLTSSVVAGDLVLVEQGRVLSNARNVPLHLLPEQAVAPDSVQIGDLWDRVRRGFGMQHFQTPEVERYEQWYSGHGDYFYRMSERSGRYLHYILGEIERRKMPTELALLPMVESAFNPAVYSSSGASGIWQFIPSTGKNFGLQQNWWYDERRNIVEATNGALDYLQRLYAMFGDWELALAAYNWGEGSVARAQRKNRDAGLPTDYLSLTLPEQTKNYVPKLIAISRIIENPSYYDLALAEVLDRPYFAKVPLEQHIDKKVVAQLAEISEEEFSALNPGSDRPVILKNNNDYLLLPVEKVAAFQYNLANYDKPLVSWQAYSPSKKERVDQIAKRLGVSVNKLKEANGLNSGSEMVQSSQTILVPSTGEDDLAQDFKAFNMHLPFSSPSERKARKPKLVTHTIRKGDTLYQLARKYKIPASQIRELNDKKKLKTLKLGDVLVISKS